MAGTPPPAQIADRWDGARRGPGHHRPAEKAESAGVRPTGPALGMSAPSSHSSAHTDGAPAWRANSRTSTRGRSPRRGGSRGAAPQRHSEGVAVSGRWVPATLRHEPPLIRIKREDKTDWEKARDARVTAQGEENTSHGTARAEHVRDGHGAAGMRGEGPTGDARAAATGGARPHGRARSAAHPGAPQTPGAPAPCACPLRRGHRALSCPGVVGWAGLGGPWVPPTRDVLGFCHSRPASPTWSSFI